MTANNIENDCTPSKRNFQKIVKIALGNIGKTKKIEAARFTYGRGQYKDCVFWVHVYFSEGFKLKKKYSNVTGYNIMPYRITEIIVDNACLTDKKNHPFNKGVKSDKSDLLYDFDVKTGNFHVNMNKQKRSRHADCIDRRNIRTRIENR